ncbi:MAG TPA: MarR family transcriptional regulator [Anaerolineales bacterium]|nr:MarR family transcriptional regulator [Anaerolineales bacterium]
MIDDPTFAAREILEILPLVMRTLRTQLGKPAELPSPGHFPLLFMLTEGPHSLSELAEKHNVTLPTMSRTISTLSEHGFVRRSPSEEDRRRVVIVLTETGAALLRRIMEEAVVHLAAVLGALSPDERRKLIDGLAVLRAAFAQTKPSNRISAP